MRMLYLHQTKLIRPTANFKEDLKRLKKML